MNKGKLFFVTAGAAFACMAAGVFAYVYLPEPSMAAILGSAKSKIQGKGWDSETEKGNASEAECEVARFMETYGIEIELAEMEKQIAIRDAYERDYKKSYPLEDVFLPMPGEGSGEMDPGEDDAYWEAIEQIEAYVAVYGIDESVYAGMTAQEELRAIQERYGPLEEKGGGGTSFDTDDKQNME